jgi:hypothetical protein
MTSSFGQKGDRMSQILYLQVRKLLAVLTHSLTTMRGGFILSNGPLDIGPLKAPLYILHIAVRKNIVDLEEFFKYPVLIFSLRHPLIFLLE